MTKEELKHKFDALYNYMAASNEPKYMMLFGAVMKDMMGWMIENKPDIAERMVEKLCAIKWQQYLTRDEAEEVISDMTPPAVWPYDVWYRAMKDMGLECERDGMFNSYALWVVMNAVHSDNGNVIASLMGLGLNEAPANADYIRAVHSMALNMLMDVDGRYSVRSYFLS